MVYCYFDIVSLGTAKGVRNDILLITQIIIKDGKQSLNESNKT